MTGVFLREATLGYSGALAAGPLTGLFEAGRATAVVGPNGSGKSTLLKGLGGLLSPLAGEIGFDGLGRRDIAYLAQEDGADRSFPILVEDLIAFGFLPRRGLFGGLSAADRLRLAEAIARVGLGGVERKPVAALSGGQFQRAQFARVMAQDARLILLDEPFTMLDARTASDLESLVAEWTRENRVVVAVLHDFDLVRRLCPQTLVLAGTAVAWGPTEAVLTVANLDRAQALAEVRAAQEAA
jgi:zinc/manganese transport system ATP-binding protein